jgi:hypothetical protein
MQLVRHRRCEYCLLVLHRSSDQGFKKYCSDERLNLTVYGRNEVKRSGCQSHQSPLCSAVVSTYRLEYAVMPECFHENVRSVCLIMHKALEVWGSGGLSPPFLIAALDGDEHSVSLPDRCIPCTQWAGGRMGPSADLDAIEIRNTSGCSPPLYRLSHPDSLFSSAQEKYGFCRRSRAAILFSFYKMEPNIRLGSSLYTHYCAISSGSRQIYLCCCRADVYTLQRSALPNPPGVFPARSPHVRWLRNCGVSLHNACQAELDYRRYQHVWEVADELRRTVSAILCADLMQSNGVRRTDNMAVSG